MSRSRWSRSLVKGCAAGVCLLALAGCTTTARRFEGPDLSVTMSELAALPSSPTVGERAVVSAVVRCVGTAPTRAVTGAFYIDGQLLRPTVAIPALQPGESREYRANWIPPRIGRARLEFRVDLYDAAREIRTGNNQAIRLVSVLDPAPTGTIVASSTVSEGEACTTPPSAGDDVVIASDPCHEENHHATTTTNNGNGRQREENEHRRDGDDRRHEDDDHATTTANNGNHREDEDRNGESDRPASGGFDLAVEPGSFGVSAGNGRKLRLTVRVMNVGDVDQDATAHLRFTVDGESLNPQRPVPRLAPGESATITFDLRSPAPGSHQVAAALSFSGNRGDRDAGNNTATATMHFPAV